MCVCVIKEVWMCEILISIIAPSRDQYTDVQKSVISSTVYWKILAAIKVGEMA